MSAVPGGPEAAQAAERRQDHSKSVEEVENAAMAAVVVGNREAQQTAPSAPFKTGAQEKVQMFRILLQVM